MITVREKILFKKNISSRTEWSKHSSKRHVAAFRSKNDFLIARNVVFCAIALHFITDYAFTRRSFAPCWFAMISAMYKSSESLPAAGRDVYATPIRRLADGMKGAPVGLMAHRPSTRLAAVIFFHVNFLINLFSNFPCLRYQITIIITI